MYVQYYNVQLDFLFVKKSVLRTVQPVDGVGNVVRNVSAVNFIISLFYLILSHIV